MGNVEIHAALDKEGLRNLYQSIAPRPVDQADLQSAMEKLAELPLDAVPAVAPAPVGSRVRYDYNSLFVGREQELRCLAATLKGGETAAVGQTAVVTGMGGIGKTQLAAAFVHHYGQFFQGGVFWLSMVEPDGIAAEVADCGLLMAIDVHHAALDLATQVRLVLSAWQSEMPRLLVFDNCEEPALLATWRPPMGGCRVLVTSQHSSWEPSLHVQGRALETLNRLQSVELLRRFPAQSNPPVPGYSEEEEVVLGQIAAELGDLPLALHLAGSYLTHYRHDLSPQAYLAQLQRPGLLDHRSLQLEGHSPTGHEQHVARTFALSYERLEAEVPSDALAIALLVRAAHFLPGEPIPRRLLLAARPDESEASGQADEPDVALERGDALRRLADVGLVEIELTGDIRLHRLIAAFVLSVAGEAERSQAQGAVESVVLLEASRLNSLGVPGPLLAWQNHLRHVVDGAAVRSDMRAAALCNTLGFLLDMAGELKAARPYYEQALEICRDLLGEKHRDTAGILNNLGGLLEAMGELEAARPYYEQALAIRRDVLGEKHPETAQSLNNLGALLAAMGELEAAQSYIQQALEIRRDVLGEKHPDTAGSLNNLGSLLAAMGELEAARDYYEQALQVLEETLGATHPTTVIVRNNLATLK